MSVFKSYDIRGEYPAEWDAKTAYRIGRSLPSVLTARSIVVGRDARLTSEEILHALTAGIIDSGCSVTDVGLCCTPALYFATSFYQFDGSVMITASHNPSQYNGLKISRRNSIPVGYDSGLNELEELASKATPSGWPKSGEKGSRRSLDIRSAYLKHIARFKHDIGALRVVVDCSDGMAGVFIHDVIADLPASFTVLYDVPDGRFPHHEPNPLVESNLADLKNRVIRERADVGICFDGDADRVMFVDERGTFVSPDLVTALLGLHFFVHYPQKEDRAPTVLYDVRSSRSVVEYLEALGATPAMCKVGHSFAKRLLRETNGIYGGELAGHYYFRDNYYCDSGMIAALLLLSILSREAAPLSRLISRIQKYAFSGEINFTARNKAAVVEHIRSGYGHGRVTTLDGIRIDFPDWWFNLRPSNTEPLLRLVVEAATEEDLRTRVGELRSRIEIMAEQ